MPSGSLRRRFLACAYQDYRLPIGADADSLLADWPASGYVLALTDLLLARDARARRFLAGVIIGLARRPLSRGLRLGIVGARRKRSKPYGIAGKIR